MKRMILCSVVLLSSCASIPQKGLEPESLATAINEDRANIKRLAEVVTVIVARSEQRDPGGLEKARLKLEADAKNEKASKSKP